MKQHLTMLTRALPCAPALLLALCMCSLGASAQRQRETIVPYEDTQARMLDVQTNVHFKPLVVELKVRSNAPSGVVKGDKKVISQSLQARTVGKTVEDLPKLDFVEIQRGGKAVGVYHFCEAQLLGFDKNPSNLRSWATFRLTQDTDCDVIVGATYDIYYEDALNCGAVTIFGFPAVFQDWRTMDKTDLEWIREEKEYGKKTEFDKVKPVIAPQSPALK